MNTVTISEILWKWAQDEALLLAALRLVGVEQWPGWAEAQRMVQGSAPAQATELAAPTARIVR